MSVRLGDERLVAAGVDYWFMLADRGALGALSSSPFSPKTTTGAREYADYDALSVVAFSDLSGGMGQELATDPTRYYDAQNVDARGGRIVLGPLPHYNQATPTGIDSVCTGLLDGSDTVGSLDFLAVDSSRTKVAAKFVVPAGVTTIDRFWVPLKASVGAGTVTVGVYNDDAGAPGTLVDSTTLDRDTFRFFGSWLEAAFDTSLNVSAGTTYWLSVEHSGSVDSVAWYGGAYAASTNSNALQWNGSAWVAVDDGSYWHVLLWYDDPLLRPDSPLQYIMGAGEDGIVRLWGYAGRRLYYLNASSVPTAVEDGVGAAFEADAKITDAVWFRDAADTHPILYLALGDGTDYVTFDGNIGTEEWVTVTAIQARKLAVYDNIIWRCDERNQVSGSLDGESFGNAVSVGERTYAVANMISWNGALYCGKEDGLYKVTYPTGYPTSETPVCEKILNFTSQADGNNFSFMVQHQNDLFFPIGQGIMQFSVGGTLSSITPDTGLDLAASERALFRAAYSSLNVLFVVTEGPPGGNSSLLAYLDRHWHPLVTMPREATMARSVAVEPGYYGDIPRVWFGAGLQVAYVKMPTTTQKRWTWSGVDWAVSGFIDLPWVDGNIRTVSKDWISAQVNVQGVGSGAGEPYVQVWWRPDEDTAWVQVGANVTSTGLVSVDFPASSHGAKAQLRVYLYRGTLDGAVTTPQVEAVVLKYLERPEDLLMFTRSYLFSSSLALRNGQTTTLSLAQQLGQLETLRESAEPLTFYPWFGTEETNYTVHIVDYTWSEVRTASSDEVDRGSVNATIRLQVI